MCEKILVCKECGSKNIQMLAWVDVNSNNPNIDPITSGDIENNWCKNCSEYTRFITKEEYEKENL